MSWKTIAKNRWDKFTPRITNARSFTLDGGFVGQPIPDGFDFASHFRKFEPKIQWNPETGAGVAKFHSNWWIDFKIS